jgi:hypothetical protein
MIEDVHTWCAMPRTDEQRNADARVQAAIEHWLEVNELLGDGVAEERRVLTDYVVYAATRGFTLDESDDVTGYPFIMRPGMPTYCAVGLAECGVANMLEAFNDSED